MAEDATLAVPVIQLRAIRISSLSRHEKDFSRRKHSESWRSEIDPKSVPVASAIRRAELASGIRAHPRKGRFEGDARRNQEGREVAGVRREDAVIGRHE